MGVVSASLQMRKLGFRVVRKPAQEHTVNECQSKG